MSEKKWVEVLKNCSSLDMPEVIQSLDFYNRQNSVKIMENLDKEFSGKEGVIRGFIVPAFISIFDSLAFESNNKYIKNFCKSGLTPERLISELSDFSYDIEGYSSVADKSADLKFISNKTYNKDIRREIDNISYRNKAKENKFKDKQYINSDYSNKRIYKNEKSVIEKGLNNTNSKVTEVDHVKPLKKIFEDLKDNIALDNKDIKEIANIDDNLAYSERDINRSKRDDTNTEYINSDKPKVKSLDDKTKAGMIQQERKANKALEKKQNEVVLRNLKDIKKGKEVAGKIAAKSAIDNSKYALGGVGGDALVYFLKASFFELTDSVKNGVQFNTNTVTNVSAFAYRMKRVGKFILSKLKGILSNNLFEFIKNLIVSIIKSLISLFAGVIAKLGKIIVGGINSIIKAIKILAIPSSEMSWQVKADSIVKIISSTIILCCGDLVDILINKIPFLNNYIKIVKPIIMGLLVAIVGYLLDKIDLFNVKKNQRVERIKEIFQLRTTEIVSNTEEFIELTEKLLEEQMKLFKGVKNELIEALLNDDSKRVLEETIKFKEYFNVNEDNTVIHNSKDSKLIRRVIQF